MRKIIIALLIAYLTRALLTSTLQTSAKGVAHLKIYIRSLLLLAAALPVAAHELPLDKLNLKPGFSIEVFAEVINPRQLARSPDGVIFAGSRRKGQVYAIVDDDNDFKADRIITIDKDLKLPSGVAFRDGDLYVGAVNRLLRYRNITDSLESPPAPEVITSELPSETHHGWKFIDFGPDNYLYVPVGAPCNLCLSENPWYASILRIDLDADVPSFEIFAEGVRNTVGFDWHPRTQELWFTDNGRDLMGDDIPPCELNHAPEIGSHFGYPYFHGKGIADPEFGTDQERANFREPALLLGPHVAPLGMHFYRGDMFPAEYKHQIFITEHGSWNRTPEAGHTGYRVTLARADAAGNLSYETFIDGWLSGKTGWGRPADLLELPDGSLLISDDTGNVIYRVSYTD